MFKITIKEFKFKKCKGTVSFKYETEEDANKAFFELVEIAKLKKNNYFGDITEIIMTNDNKLVVSFDNSLDVHEYTDGIPLGL
jgi:hypothetical protein